MNIESKTFQLFLPLIFGSILIIMGLFSLNHLTSNVWPFEVERLDLMRDIATGQADSTQIMQSARLNVVFTFITSSMVTIIGLSLPLFALFNLRLDYMPTHKNLLVSFRQSILLGIWIAFLLWLNIHRTLGIGVTVLSLSVFVMIESFLQIRTKADLEVQQFTDTK